MKTHTTSKLIVEKDNKDLKEKLESILNDPNLSYRILLEKAVIDEQYKRIMGLQ